MKRKLISVSLALALGLSLAACGSKPAPSGAETPAGELGTLSGPVALHLQSEPPEGFGRAGGGVQ